MLLFHMQPASACASLGKDKATAKSGGGVTRKDRRTNVTELLQCGDENEKRKKIIEQNSERQGTPRRKVNVQIGQKHTDYITKQQLA